MGVYFIFKIYFHHIKKSKRLATEHKTMHCYQNNQISSRFLLRTILNNLQKNFHPKITAVVLSQNPYGFSMFGMVTKKRVWDTHRPMRGMIPWKRPTYPDSFTMCLKVCTNDLGGSPFAALLWASIRITSKGWFHVDSTPPMVPERAW